MMAIALAQFQKYIKFILKRAFRLNDIAKIKSRINPDNGGYLV